MNKISDKQYKTYDYTSRYSGFPIYYNEVDKKYIYGITSNLSERTSYTLHNLSDYDTLDSLALHYYGRPDLYWIIADFNRIRDPFIKLSTYYKSLKIPSMSDISFED